MQICEKNYTELKETIAEFERRYSNRDPDPKDIEKFTLLVSQKLHNFVTSTYSVYRHSKTISDKYFSKEEQETVAERSNNTFGTRAAFLKRLRAFIQKTRMPDVRCREYQRPVDYHRDTNPDIAFYLQKDELESWDGWNADAKKHLDSLGESIDIEHELSLYHEEFVDFNRWIANFLKDSYSKEITKRNRLVKRLKRISNT